MSLPFSQTMRYEAMHNMWKAWTLMLAHGIKPTEFSYEIFILFVCRHSNLELALQKLSEMGTADLTPSLKSAQAVISLACDMGQPRLAVELAEAFERSSVRRLDGVVWIKCLIASADALYVRPTSTHIRTLLSVTIGRWCPYLLG